MPHAIITALMSALGSAVSTDAGDLAATQSDKSGNTSIAPPLSVPQRRMPAMFAAVAALVDKHGFRIPMLANAADGNLHPTFLVQAAVVPDAIWEAAGE